MKKCVYVLQSVVGGLEEGVASVYVLQSVVGGLEEGVASVYVCMCCSQ